MPRRTGISSILFLGAVSLLMGQASARPIRRPVPTYEQTLSAVVACGVPLANVHIRYEDEFQSNLVGISDLGGTDEARLRCLKDAVHVAYIVFIEAEDQRIAYFSFADREDRDRIRASREVQLQRIAGKCGLPERAFRLNEEGQVRFRPPPEARYQAIDCALGQLRKTGLNQTMPLGFVGNEAYDTGNKH